MREHIEDILVGGRPMTDLEIELQQRIDKAIEYIEKHYNYENFTYLSDEDTDKLLEILKGEDKEC